MTHYQLENPQVLEYAFFHRNILWSYYSNYCNSEVMKEIINEVILSKYKVLYIKIYRSHLEIVSNKPKNSIRISTKQFMLELSNLNDQVHRNK